MGVMHRLIILSYKVYTPAYAGQVPIGMCTCLLYTNKYLNIVVSFSFC